MQTLRPENPNYPKELSLLRRVPDPLYIEGHLTHLDVRPRLGIVGARQAHPWVQEWMEHELMPLFRSMRLCVVSGGARGVDQWAHLLAQRAQVPTLVVVPSGLHHKYPSQLRAWQGRDGVSFLSEYSPEQRLRRHFFYRRNQLIAALSDLCLVIQASEKSGTMMTAHYARDLGVPLATLPANPIDTHMTGNNHLLYQGAHLVRNRHDLKALLMTLPHWLRHSKYDEEKRRPLEVK